LAKFWTPADWLPYSLDLKLLDFSTLSVLQAKVQAMPHADLAVLHLSITAEWEWLTAEYIAGPAATWAVVTENGTDTESMCC
jgi:hypothetical protein